METDPNITFIINPTNITFVTAYLDIYDDQPPLERTNDWRTKHFKKIAETGIQLCVYVSPSLFQELTEYAEVYKNIKIMKSVSIEDTWVYKTCSERTGTYSLPDVRYHPKDTEKYMFMQHSKTEFVQDAILNDPWNSTHFAWIDFSIAYMFKNLEKSKQQLINLSNAELKLEDMFIFPGCWGKWDVNRYEHHRDNIHWRWCGCFFLGDKNSVKSFCNLAKEHFVEFLELTGKLMWEVNYWAWLEHINQEHINQEHINQERVKDATSEETQNYWTPIFYDADHNDRCINIPIEFLSIMQLKNNMVKTCEYDNIEYYQPGSASLVEFEEKKWLNTRFVNYYFTPDGYYVYPEGPHIIKNKNILSELSFDGEIPFAKDFREIDEKTIDLSYEPLPNTFSEGFEDIRLYNFQDKVRFIATTVNYSKVGRGRMITGDYDIVNAKYSNCQLIIPPNPDSWIEKNWVPIVRCNNDCEEEWFIYKWSPMELGKVKVNETGEHHLEIVERFTVIDPWFDRFRGSTTFTKTPEGLLGLTHFSIEKSPRRYYHCLVILDQDTFKPLKRSEPFYFLKESIEFCIGMDILNETSEYLFWISQMDRETTLIKVDQNVVKWVNVNTV